MLANLSAVLSGRATRAKGKWWGGVPVGRSRGAGFTFGGFPSFH